MTKKEMLDDPDSVWNRTAADEPVFPLVARDITAPEAVSDWAARATERGVRMEKIEGANKVFDEMMDWQVKNGTKEPD